MDQIIIIFTILLSSILINNFVLSQFLGICSFLGVSKKLESAVGMGIAVIFVMALASVITWILQYTVLVPLNITFMQTIVFIVVIATLVQLVEMVIKKTSPSLYKSLGVYLPLITTNCAVLGVALINITDNYTLLESLVNGVGAAVGFTIAIVLFAGIRERLDFSYIPKALHWFPMALISAGLMSLAFMGFQSLTV